MIPASSVNQVAVSITHANANPNPVTEHCHNLNPLNSLKITVVDMNQFEKRKRKVSIQDNMLNMEWPVKKNRRPLVSKSSSFTQSFVHTVFDPKWRSNTISKVIAPSTSRKVGAPFKPQSDVQAKVAQVQRMQRLTTQHARPRFDPKTVAVIPNLAPRCPEVSLPDPKLKSVDKTIRKTPSRKKTVAPKALFPHTVPSCVTSDKDHTDHLRPTTNKKTSNKGNTTTARDKTTPNELFSTFHSLTKTNIAPVRVTPQISTLAPPIDNSVPDSESFDIDTLFTEHEMTDVSRDIEEEKRLAQEKRRQLPILTQSLTDRVELMDVELSLFGLQM